MQGFNLKPTPPYSDVQMTLATWVDVDYSGTVIVITSTQKFTTSHAARERP
jgi:hypothetical protein